MSGSLNRDGGENIPGIIGTCATRKFTYLARGPWGVYCDPFTNNDNEVWSIHYHVFPDGKLPVPQEYPSWQEVIKKHSDISHGGRHRPSDCRARQRVAVIIPYRDRERHLRLLLYHVITIFKRHQMHFRIFVVEQVSQIWSRCNDVGNPFKCHVELKTYEILFRQNIYFSYNIVIFYTEHLNIRWQERLDDCELAIHKRYIEIFTSYHHIPREMWLSFEICKFQTQNGDPYH